MIVMYEQVVQGGDAVWEGLRVYDGRVFELDAHLDRMQASAKVIGKVSKRKEGRGGTGRDDEKEKGG